MKALRLSGGDLVPGAEGFETITGASRIVQDLRVALSEPLGIDRFHTGWGSVIDDFVGQPLDSGTAFAVKQEINRVVGNYMMVQAEKAARGSLRSGSGRYTTDDLISHVASVDVRMVNDQLTARITLTMVSGREVESTVEVQPNG